MRSSACLIPCICALFLSSPLAAQDPWPFPLQVDQDRGVDGLVLSMVPELLDGIAAFDEVRLVDVPLPGGATVDLALHRVRVASVDAVLSLDGALEPLPELDLSMWSGTVNGEVDSEAFLALSRHGSRGWIRHAGKLLHLVADLSSGTEGRAVLVADSRLQELGTQPELLCEASRMAQPTGPRLPVQVPDGPAPKATAFSPLYECRIALETDFQFFQVLGSAAAAQAYAESLFGAVSERYRSQIGVVLTMPYLAIYTQNNDPWQSQDSGGNCIDVLYEFRNAWGGGGAPIQADLYHMLSGGNLGCGVAWLDVLCNQDFGFSVSGNIHGQTAIPIIPGDPLNWDFMVMAHELGHNFSTPHTHDYCPPLDQCAPSGFFGGCQSSQVCTSQGTIMSYCHLCGGGLMNVTTFFHPTVSSVMRNAAASGCLALFEGLFITDLGSALPGSGGVPALDGSYDAGTNTLTLGASGAPASEIGVLFASGSAIMAPFQGGVLVPAPDLGLPLITTGAGTWDQSFPIAIAIPSGAELYMQAWFLDGGAGVASTNGSLLELWIP